MPSLPDFRLEAHFSKWEFKARHHLTASDMESVDVAELLSWADVDDREAWRTLRLGYTETYGAPALRRAIAATYETLTAEDVLCFAGAGEAIYVAMQVLLGHDAGVAWPRRSCRRACAELSVVRGAATAAVRRDRGRAASRSRLGA